MDAEQIKAAKQLKLKPNRYLRDTSIPYNYQTKMALLMLVRPRMLNGDDVGLGKTIESIVAYTYLKDRRPNLKLLVMTEKLSLRQWQEEFAWMTKGIRTRIITATTHRDATQRARAFRTHGADVLITTYSQAYKYARHIADGMGSLWIFEPDEPNIFKNTTTKIHAQCDWLANQSPNPPIRGWGATATIVENRLEEAFAILKIIAPGTFSSRMEFDRRHVVYGETRDGRKVVTGYKNLREFRQKIEPVFFGRMADDPDVDKELPEVFTKDVPVTMSEAQSEKVLEATDRIFQLPDGTYKQVDILPSLILAQQMANDPRLKGFEIPGMKTDGLQEVLFGALQGQQTLVYSKYRQTIDLIEKELAGTGLRVGRITGKETQEQRERAKDMLWAGELDIVLGTRAFAKAVNLQAAAHLIMYDMPWSYGLYRQLRGRIRRHKSRHKLIGVWHMLAEMHPSVAQVLGDKKTIDHYTLGIVKRKAHLWNEVTGDSDSIESSPSDFVDIMNAIKAKEDIEWASH